MRIKKPILRLLGVIIIAFAFVSPAFAEDGEDCESYCQGYCEGFCSAQGKVCHYQGYQGTWPGCKTQRETERAQHGLFRTCTREPTERARCGDFSLSISTRRAAIYRCTG